MNTDGKDLEHIVVFWNSKTLQDSKDAPNPVFKFLKEEKEKKTNNSKYPFMSSWRLIGNYKDFEDLKNTDLQPYKKAIVLAELNWEGRNFVDCLGIHIVKRLFSEKHFLKPVLICSFLDKDYIYKQSDENQSILNFTSFGRLPFAISSYKISFYSDEETLNKYYHNLFDLYYEDDHEKKCEYSLIIDELKDMVNNPNSILSIQKPEWWNKIKTILKQLYEVYKYCNKQQFDLPISIDQREKYINCYNKWNRYIIGYSEMKSSSAIEKLDFLDSHVNLLKQRKNETS